MKFTGITTIGIALTVLSATPALAQTCGVLDRLDDFGTIRLGSSFQTVPQGLSIVEQCDDGVAAGVCVLRDADGVTYTLYNSYVISKFVFVGDGELPWGFRDDLDRTRAAQLLTAETRLRSSGVLAEDNELHVRSQFACGEARGQAFARYSGNRLVAVGVETVAN